ncbi:MAG: hypothetical protein GYB68_02460 [Chloroflexi bacterium]|nr:hypothetical protein [Chloroflexota bacterium]
MSEHRFPQDVIDRNQAALNRQMRWLAALVVLVGGGAGIGFGAAGLFSPAIIAVTVVLYILVMMAALFLFRRAQLDHWMTFRIVVEPERISRFEGGRKAIIIEPKEITKLYELDEGGLVIQTERTQKTIVAHAELGDYERLRQQVLAWREPDSLPGAAPRAEA